MSEKFDEFSKHLATRQSRRGIFKVLGAGVIGAALSTVLAPKVDAGVSPRTLLLKKLGNSPDFNGTIPPYDYTLPPVSNQTKPDFNNTLPPRRPIATPRRPFGN